MGTTNTSGMHRAKLWQIGGFAFNNTATNLYMFMMNFIAYYLTGYVGAVSYTHLDVYKRQVIQCIAGNL